LWRGESAAARGDFFHHHHCLARRHPHAAVLLGDQHAEPAVRGELVDELLWIRRRAVALSPVLVVERRTEVADAPSNERLLLGEVDGVAPVTWHVLT